MSWAEVPFEELYVVPSRNGVYKSKEEHGNGTKIINMGELFAYEFVGHQEMARLNMSDQELEISGLQEGDLLFGRRSLVESGAGKCSIVLNLSESVTFESSIIRVRLQFHRCEPLFYYYWFRSHFGRGRMRSIVSGTNVKGIRGSDLKRLSVVCPHLDEQRAIVGILKSYDDLIENNQRRIALLEQAARLLYREWFVNLSFPGHEHVKIVNGLPEGWTRRSLRSFAVTNGSSFVAKELPDPLTYIDISSVSRGAIVARTAMIASEAPGRARRKANDGDTIWSNVRPNLRGYALVLKPSEADVFSTGFTILTPTDVPFTWLYQFVTTEDFIGHLINHATGVSYPAVRPDDFERAVAAVPTPVLLQLFHEATEPNLRLISTLRDHNDKLAQARDLLLPRLMSGEIAV